MTAAATSTGTPALSRLAEPAADLAIEAAAKTLQLPTIRAQAQVMAAAAAKQRLSHKAFLAEMLTAECDERDARRRVRLVNEAKFPRTKRLADFDHTRIPDLTPAVLGHLAGGAWIEAGEPLVLLGDSGTGKTHLLIGLGTAAAEQGRRVRYLTCAQLVNELAEAADDRQLTRVVGRYARIDLLCLDEVGYLTLDPRGAELLFQIITAGVCPSLRIVALNGRLSPRKDGHYGKVSKVQPGISGRGRKDGARNGTPGRGGGP
jgi:DNA replication protein DnaC